MKDSEVYRKAAEFLHNQPDHHTNGMCWAITMNGGPGLTEDYIELFRPGEDRKHWLYWGANWRPRKLCRILALCFMAAIAESEGR